MKECSDELRSPAACVDTHIHNISEETIVSRSVKLAVELTKSEAYALQRAIDDYFQSCGMADNEASDLIERMHSKVSDALVAGGHHFDDSGAASLFWN
jgi:hypothetical protein